MKLSCHDCCRLISATLAGMTAGVDMEAVAQDPQVHATYYVSNDGSDAADGQSPVATCFSCTESRALPRRPGTSSFEITSSLRPGATHSGLRPGQEKAPIP